MSSAEKLAANPRAFNHFPVFEVVTNLSQIRAEACLDIYSEDIHITVLMEADDQHRVLVLNRVWQPINVVGAQRAFSLLFQDHAQVIDPNDGDFRIYDGDQWIDHSLKNPPKPNQAAMHTVRMALLVPKVLLLRAFDRVPVKEVRFSRQSIFERDGFRCQYTGRIFPPKMLNIDHVIPRDRGGRTTWENVVTSSIHCNTLKANRLPHEAGLKLIRKPAKPKSRPFVSHLMGTQYDQAWSYFLESRECAASEA